MRKLLRSIPVVDQHGKSHFIDEYQEIIDTSSLDSPDSTTQGFIRLQLRGDGRANALHEGRYVVVSRPDLVLRPIQS